MVIRWVYVATLVVTTLSIVSGKQNQTQLLINGDNIDDLCPCLQRHICPRIFGSKPEDTKYLGDLMKCEEDNKVRCCGASASYVVGMGTQAPMEKDVLPSPHSRDDNENEIPDFGKLKVLRRVGGDGSETPDLRGTNGVTNFVEINEAIDQEAAESQSITETAETKTSIDRSFEPNVSPDDTTEESNNNELEVAESESITEIVSRDDDLRSLNSEISNIDDATTMEPVNTIANESAAQSRRQPKKLNNVFMVFPNEMSGIPKTTPRNMPETNELKMFDEEMGMNLHLVFSKTTSMPIIQFEATTRIADESTVKEPTLNFGDRQKRRKYVKGKRTTESPTLDAKSTTQNAPTTVIKPSVKSFPKRRFNAPESTDSTIKVKSRTSKVTTETPIIQDEEILHHSDDDKSHQNRFRLFRARNRAYLLRRSSTTTTTATTEAPLQRTTHLEETLNAEKNLLEINETIVNHIDTHHQSMIKNVRVALVAASPKQEHVEIPRSFGSADMDKRVRKIEKMLAGEMINAFNEIKLKQETKPKNMESDSLVDVKQSTTTEQPIKQTKSITTRPYRGKKKFAWPDLVPNEIHRTRTRSTTVRPVTEITSTDTSTRFKAIRRPTTTTVEPIHTEQTNENAERERDDSFTPTSIRDRFFRKRAQGKRINSSRSSTTTTLATTQSTSVLTTTETTTTQETTENSPSSATHVSEVTEELNITVQSEKENTLEMSTEPKKIEDPSPLLPIKTNENDSHDNENSQLNSSKTIRESKPEILPESMDINDNNKESLSSNISSDFKPSPLWSIKFDEPPDDPDYIDDKNVRHSRNIFQAPTDYIYGFVPLTSMDRALPIIGPIPRQNIFTDDTRVRYDLPSDIKENSFS